LLFKSSADLDYEKLILFINRAPRSALDLQKSPARTVSFTVACDQLINFHILMTRANKKMSRDERGNIFFCHPSMVSGKKVR
jgi:hypothetical protein